MFKNRETLKRDKMKKVVIISCITAILLIGIYYYSNFTTSTDSPLNGEWRNIYMGKGSGILMDIIPVSSGYIAVGATKEDGQKWDGWILMVDKNGNKLWEKFYGSQEEDLFSRIV